jgi:iron complex outermembrane recepter protein
MVRSLFVFIISLFSFSLSAQYAIQGKVFNSEGEPLIGANITVNNSHGVITDNSGSFNFKKLSAATYLLKISFIGFETILDTIDLKSDINSDFQMKPSSILAEDVIVSATRPIDKSNIANTNLSKQEIGKSNLGQDLPFLMTLTPSVVATSDAGTGVGYTNFRIRGTDANRINITVNGIPMNDAESHGVWWVNMPDFSSSIENIQVQRGIGTSTNGAGAFGATINMQTEKLNKTLYTELASSAGSFNTFKNTIKVGTGLLNNHFAFDMRLSKITSDGYIDRAWSDLKSYYFSGGYYSKNTILKTVIFSGKERTYQSWSGVPKVRLENDSAGMQRYEDHGLFTPEQTREMLESDSRTYNFYSYKDQTDNYQQDHYQLLLSQNLGKRLNLNTSLHYTYGRGNYEEFASDAKLADYLISPIFLGNDSITSSDLVREKWLDNDFYGLTFSLNFNSSNLKAVLGGEVNNYNGRHFGNVIWGKYLGEIPPDYEWYRSTGDKLDYNIYGKASYDINQLTNVFVDLQYRHIEYEIKGIDDDLRIINQNHNYNFINPKAGITIKPANDQQLSLLYAMGHREPNRDNLTYATPGGLQPKPETMHDFELGYSYQSYQLSASINLYYMYYIDQLILTGQINDVGSAIMANVNKSFRSGIELTAAANLTDKLKWNVNTTISQNKILSFNEYIDNWDTGLQDINEIGTTDIAFSPAFIANSIFEHTPVKNFSIILTSQFVEKQYIDNTGSSDRMLDPYFVNNLSFNYSIKPRFMREIDFQLMINNILNEQYESNAWAYSYIYEGERFTMDGYFPQAGINFLAGITLKF